MTNNTDTFSQFKQKIENPKNIPKTDSIFKSI